MSWSMELLGGQPQQEEPKPPSYSKQMLGDYGVTDLAVHKFTLGLSDKAVAAGRAGVNSALEAVGLPRTDQGSYDANLAAIDAQREAYQQANPAIDWATSPINLLGGASAAVPAGIGAIRAGAEAGAISGGLSGFGRSRGDVGDTVADVAIGAAAGGALGAGAGYVAPKFGNAVEWGVDKVKSYLPFVKNQPASQATQILLKKLQEDGLSPADAAKALDEARARGVPLALGDLGDNLRGATAELANKPGAARTTVRSTLNERQMGMGERITGAIQRSLGPTANVREASEQLMKAARAKAGPLYDEAYNVPVSWTVEPGSTLNRILATPAGKQALQKAYTNAANNMDDPKALGFNLNQQGEVVLEGVPSFRTLDYVKRGLDDVVEGYRDKTTGKLVLDDSGRTVNNVRALLNQELRRINPKYGEALDAYAGDAQMADALRRGSSALNKTADDIAAETQRMSPAELEQYRLGIRSAMVRSIEANPDGGNKVRLLIGSEKKRKVVEKLFGGTQGLDDLVKTLDDEAKVFATNQYAMTGSRTAPLQNEGQDMDTFVNMLDAGVNMKNGRYINALRVLFRGKDMNKLSDVTREELAKALTTADPLTFQAVLRQVTSAESQQAARLARNLKLGQLSGFGAGSQF